MTLDDLMNTGVGDDAMDIDAPFKELEKGRQTQKQARWQRQDDGQGQMGMQQYNPFAPRQNASFDAQVIDRRVTIKKPIDAVPGDLWIFDAEFMETFGWPAMNKSDQMRFGKQAHRVQMLSKGELNAHIVESRQNRIMHRIVMQRARKDVVEGGNLNESELEVTSMHKEEQTIRTPSQQQPRGFVGSVLGGLLGR